jgi:DNA polymerase-3 subunit gamma/tau
MAGYLVLARKYRSRTFEEVIGQEPIAQTLRNAIATGRVAHAYLFTGTRGVGKTTMARILAKALNCLSFEEPTTEPCNQCDACQAISRGDDIDVVEIDGASNRGIDEIRELRANAIYRPARCRYKIYYIDEVHMLTKEAFNALLKTLEEPPGHVKFIFATTEAEKVPATILSRCQRFDFRNIPTRQIAEHLRWICRREDVPAEDDALFRVARAAAGSMRDGLSLLDQLLASSPEVTDRQVAEILGTPPDERTAAVAAAIARGEAKAALHELAELIDSGAALAGVVEALGEMFRNLMLAATCGPDSELIELPESRRAVIAELAGKFTTPALVHAVGVIARMAQATRGSSVARALVEAGIVRLAESEKFLDPDGLVRRLEALRSATGSPGGRQAAGASRGGAPRRPFDRGAAAAGPAAEPRPSAPSARQGPAPQTSPPPRPAPEARAPAEDSSAHPPAEASNSAPRLSTAEKQQLREDPAVREVLGLFGGEVSAFGQNLPPAPPAGEDAPEDVQDPGEETEPDEIDDD